MVISNYTCPLCLYEAPLFMFENVGDGKLKCKRCRSRYEDPHAMGAEVSYADCDSRHAVTRFPFMLNGENTMVYVRPGYLAFVLGNNGQRFWLSAPENHITSMSCGFQLYYVCLNPHIVWGTKSIQDFGAYGTASLTVSRSFVESYCNVDGQIQNFEEHLRSIVINHITAYAQQLIARNNTALLKHTEGYMRLLGVVQDGLSLTKIEPKGYRDADGSTVVFSASTGFTSNFEQEEKPSSVKKVPVDHIKIPKRTYTVQDNVEDVFFRSSGKAQAKAERHKSGEIIEADALQDVDKLIRFYAKEFKFPNGWGVYNQPYGAPGYFSAHGTVSFFIDNTAAFGQLIAKTSSWIECEEYFFHNVLKKEIASALQKTLNRYIRQLDDNPNNLLSAMSVELTSILNGEDSLYQLSPAFRQYGLRVNAIDILHIDFYSSFRR